jgi:hypothetical protein
MSCDFLTMTQLSATLADFRRFIRYISSNTYAYGDATAPTAKNR